MPYEALNAHQQRARGRHVFERDAFTARERGQAPRLHRLWLLAESSGLRDAPMAQRGRTSGAAVSKGRLYLRVAFETAPSSGVTIGIAPAAHERVACGPFDGLRTGKGVARPGSAGR